MKDDIRLQTCVIIQKGKEYYAGKLLLLNEDYWVTDPYDAWKTRNILAADNKRKEVGGQLVLFNPIVKQLKKMEVKTV